MSDDKVTELDWRKRLHECAAENCHVLLYDKNDRYCQHHEGAVVFDAAYGTNVRAKVL